ncbi:MAG: diphthine--ammonia ligase [Candidatus Bathyarchaeia archaeon]
MKVVASWSGGKDGCFAVYKAIKQGFDVSNLLTLMSSDGKSNFHMLPPEMLAAQSEAVGIKLVTWRTTANTYEEEFKKALLQMKATGAKGLITGDIYEVAQHEEGWLERICKEVGLEPVKPLWLCDTKKLLREFVDIGFNATVVKVNTKALSVEWLGRELNNKFYDDITKIKNVDPCGEGGEYHTCITDGPIFRKRIRLLETEKTTQGDFSFLSIKQFKTLAK